MSIFNHIDRDKVVGFMAFYWWLPFRDWFYGIAEEPMFLHELLRRARIHRDQWDVGLRTPVPIQHEVAQLHQRGAHRTDKYGSDFALTIDIKGSFTLRKTAIFQTKLGDNYTATVEHSQLREALSAPEFAGRAFTMALDRPRGSMRVQSVDVLAAAFLNSTHATKSFDTTEWLPSTDWIVKWFDCEVGRPSSPLEASSIEGLLSSYIDQSSDGFPRFPRPEQRRDNDHLFIPEVWHHTSLTVE